MFLYVITDRYNRKQIINLEKIERIRKSGTHYIVVMRGIQFRITKEEFEKLLKELNYSNLKDKI